MMTKTVYGFDEFVTTVGDTVMVFLPSSSQHSQDSSSSVASSISITTSSVLEDIVTVTSSSATVKSKPSNTVATFSQTHSQDKEQIERLPLETMFRCHCVACK